MSWDLLGVVLGMLVGAHGVTPPNSQTSANAVLESYWACPGGVFGSVLGILGVSWGLLGMVLVDACGSSWGFPSQLPNIGERGT